MILTPKTESFLNWAQVTNASPRVSVTLEINYRLHIISRPPRRVHRNGGRSTEAAECVCQKLKARSASAVDVSRFLWTQSSIPSKYVHPLNIQCFITLNASGEITRVWGKHMAPERPASVWRWYGLICCGSICEKHREVFQYIDNICECRIHSTQPEPASLRQEVCSVLNYPAGHPGNDGDDNRNPALENQLPLFNFSCFL